MFKNFPWSTFFCVWICFERVVHSVVDVYLNKDEMKRLFGKLYREKCVNFYSHLSLSRR